MLMHPHFRRKSYRGNQQGYVLLLLLLFVSLMIIAAAAIVPSITFNIKRDREEEMIHRGAQYSRAIRAYYKKYGRYPTKLEDLESANNLRFLRKRYKDPITGQDFKLLHFGDAKLTLSGAIGGAGINGATSINGNPGLGQQLGSPPAGIGSGNSNSIFGGGQSQGLGANSNSGLGGNSATGQNPNTDTDATTQPTNGTTPAGAQEHPGVTGQDQLGNTTFGGGPIVGVVSASKGDTIREFNHKKKYSDWQFVYDPATDRGQLITTPNQPPIQGFGMQPTNLNGQSGTGITGGGINSGGINGGGINGGGINGGGINGGAAPGNPNPPTTVGPGSGDGNTPPPQQQ